VVSTSAYGAVLVVGSGVLAGYPLYAFSGDADGRPGCGTNLKSGFDLGPEATVPLTCTGPESDLVKGNATDDWPAFTTVGAPVAGRGVNGRLLATVRRRGIGDQVTYGGHPLYLFDPVSRPFDPEGEDYMETVKPLAPWHGYWFLVSPSGQLAPGRTTLEVGVLPDGRRVLAAETDPNVSPIATTVYTYSRDRTGVSSCAGACAVEWIPVLTSRTPLLRGGLDASAIGAVRQPDGSLQVTYGGRPLYFYSRERVFLRSGHLLGSGTAGNGNGMTAPQGGTFRFVPLG